MKKSLMALLFGIAALPVEASNWIQLQGSERPDAPIFRYFGFVQPTYTSIGAVPVNGLQGGAAVYNGNYSTLNLNWPKLNQPHQFQILRAGLGARGRLNESVNYFMAFDAGRNGTTYYKDAVLSDASLTYNGIPGAKLRAGLFKLPTSEEALLAVNWSSPYIYNSNAVLYLLVGLPVTAAGTVNPNGATAANLSSGFSGFRDWGVQVFDSFNRGQWEYTYAAMVSNGQAIDTPVDSDGYKDLTLRAQASYLLGGGGPNREDVSLFVWHQKGARHFGTDAYPLVREGLGGKYLQGDYRVSTEYLRARGMVVGGQAPPFVGQPFAAGVNEQASGWYVEGGRRFSPQWDINLRYDYLDFMKVAAANERELSTITLALQRHLGPARRVTFNYERRTMRVSNPLAIPAGAMRDNALAIVGNLANRASMQLTWSF